LDVVTVSQPEMSHAENKGDKNVGKVDVSMGRRIKCKMHVLHAILNKM